jgi:hypothetical protein
VTNALAARAISAQPRRGWWWRHRRYDRAMDTLMLTALPPTARPTIPSAAPDDPDLARAGLTAADAARIGEALAAARHRRPRLLYDVVWRQWQRWCADRGVAAVPADPLTVCAYLTERAKPVAPPAPSTWPAPLSGTSTAPSALSTRSRPKPSAR